MILSDEHKFIFLKTRKTAGTSIEIELSGLLGNRAVVVPFGVSESNHRPRNYRGFWNLIPELLDYQIPVRSTLSDLIKRRRFYNHISARILRHRVGRKRWSTYFKFCVERDYLSKTQSHINMRLFSGRIKDKEEYFKNRNFCLNMQFYSIDGDIVVDRIIKFEKLNTQLKEVFGGIGLQGFSTLQVRAKGRIKKNDFIFDKHEAEQLRIAFAPELEILNRCRAMGVYTD